MTEPRETKIKRLAMRSMRRGIREMDLILSAYSDVHLAHMSDENLDLYDALLSESDHDLYQWVSGQVDAPEPYGALVATISAGAEGVTRAG